MAEGHLFDAVIALSGCDKTIPGTVMALARLDIRPWALMTTVGLAPLSVAPLGVNVTVIVLATAGPGTARVCTVIVWVVPEAVPAGKVSVPLSAV